jgi:hypothetical protein
MLSGFDVQVEAFVPDSSGLTPFCRGCLVKKVGEIAVARLEAGLTDYVAGSTVEETTRAPRWERFYGWELRERATSDAYEYGPECDIPEHAKLRADKQLMWSRGEGYCPGCAEVCCEGCGKVLFSEIEEVAA